MTEVERLRDKGMVALLYLGARQEKDGRHSQALYDAAFALDIASSDQHDEDRNGVRRAMGKDDCAETEGASTLVHCPAVRVRCDECGEQATCLVSRMVVGNARANPGEEDQSANGA